MNYNEIIRELNWAVLGSPVMEGEAKLGFARFYYGDVAPCVKDIFNKYTPSGKIAIIANKKSFGTTGLEIISAIRSAGGQTINVVLGEDVDFSTDEVCGLFQVAEDVRLVVVLDYPLFDIAAYFATVRNIPMISIVRDLKPKGLLAKRVYVKNGNTIDSYGISTTRHVIFTGDVFSEKQTLADVYAYCASKIVALMDYRIVGAINGGELNRIAYYLARTAVLGVFGLSKDDKEFKEKIFSYAIKLEIADNMADGKLLNLSSPSIAEFIACGKFGKCAGVELSAACIALELYDKCFNGEVEKNVLPPDYSARAERLSKLANFNEKDLLKHFKSQISAFNFKRKKIASVKDGLKDEVKKTAKLAPRIMDRYLELGGDNNLDTALISEAIKLSGDTDISLNGMSLVRDSGLLEK